MTVKFSTCSHFKLGRIKNKTTTELAIQGNAKNYWNQVWTKRLDEL
jgi:hypothetical protein